MTQAQTKEVSNEGYYTAEAFLAAKDRKGQRLPIDITYDPKIFWDGLGAKYYESFRRQEQFQAHVSWLIDRFETLGIKEVLEVGCGFGRILPFLVDSKVVDSVNGIDISQSILDLSKEYFKPKELKWCEHILDKDGKWFFKEMGEVGEDWKECPSCQKPKPPKLEKEVPNLFEKINLQLGDVRRLEYESSSFECVYSVETMQHLSLDDVHASLLEMTRVSKKYLIFVERWLFPGEHSEPHLFSHDISSMLGGLGLDVLQVCVIGNGIQGIVAKKKELK